LIWLTGNLGFFTLRDRLQSDPVFAGRVRYISSVIKYTIDTFIGDFGEVPAPTPLTRDPESDSAFEHDLSQGLHSRAGLMSWYLSR
jgi:hypothetical protein